MYTKGIRKIFDCNNLVGRTIDECWGVAKKSGYKAMLHNDSVFVGDYKGEPIKTVFKTEDFRS